MNNASGMLFQKARDLFDPPPSDLPGRVALEVELFPIRFRSGAPQPVSVDETRGVLATDVGLSAAGGVTFEPGGQLELSPSPEKTASRLLDNVAQLLARVDACGTVHGVSFQAEGVNRWLSCDQLGLQKDTERYRKMQAHFDAIGPAGRHMMRRTASLQVCLDLLHGRAGEEQWRLLNLIGPAMSAAFTNQPSRTCTGLSNRDTRSRIWQEVDPSRTGFDGRHLQDDPIAGYFDFANRAEAIPLDAGRAEASPFRLPFGTWAGRGAGRPDSVDVAHHLTTLFPPVRPRGRYLEVRYLDSLPWPWLAVPLCLLATLSYEPTARHLALETRQQTKSIEDDWRRAARVGLGDAGIRASAIDLFDIALARMNHLPGGYLPADAVALTHAFLERFIVTDRSAAHDEISMTDANPLDVVAGVERTRSYPCAWP